MAGPEVDKSKSKPKKLARSLSKGFRKSFKRMSSGLSSVFSDRKSVIDKNDYLPDQFDDHVLPDSVGSVDSPRNADDKEFTIKAYRPDDQPARDSSVTRTTDTRTYSATSLDSQASRNEADRSRQLSERVEQTEPIQTSSAFKDASKQGFGEPLSKEPAESDSASLSDKPTMSQDLAALAEEVRDLERAFTELKQDTLYSSDSGEHNSALSDSHDESTDEDALQEAALPVASAEPAVLRERLVVDPGQEVPAVVLTHVVDTMHAEVNQPVVLDIIHAEVDIIHAEVDQPVVVNNVVLEEEEAHTPAAPAEQPVDPVQSVVVAAGLDGSVDSAAVVDDVPVEEQAVDVVPSNAQGMNGAGVMDVSVAQQMGVSAVDVVQPTQKQPHVAPQVKVCDQLLVRQAGPLQKLTGVLFKITTSRLVRVMALASASLVVAGAVGKGKLGVTGKASSCCESAPQQKQKKATSKSLTKRWF